MKDERMKNSSKSNHNKTGGMTRRKFLKGFGITSIGIAAGSEGLLGTMQASCSPAEGTMLGPDAREIALHVNGKKFVARAEPRTTLVEVLRDQLHLTGTKTGCERGACGACTVIIDGHTAVSCMTLAVDAEGREIQTIEGLEQNGQLHPLQKAFIKHDAMQCGFCTSGMIMSCKNLLDKNPNPSTEDIKLATSGNLCRCGTYNHVAHAVMSANRKDS